MIEFLSTLSNYLIEGMLGGLLVGLSLRFMVYRANRYDLMFFQSFTREVERVLISEDRARAISSGRESFLHNLLKGIAGKLPMRSVRFGNLRNRKASTTKKSSTSLRDYTHGDGSLIHSLQAESNVLTSGYKPNFYDVTERILSRDASWTKLFGTIPVDNISRFLEVMPALFIICGILGTFIGIAQALPMISTIDFQNLTNSNEVLSGFILKVTFAMNTSIVGIICSFVMTILNSLFPIESVRESILGMVEHTLERLWFFLHRGDAADSMDVIEEERPIASAPTESAKATPPGGVNQALTSAAVEKAKKAAKKGAA